jgi:hypothetical protein
VTDRYGAFVDWQNQATPTLAARIAAKAKYNHLTKCLEWTGAYAKTRNGKRPHVRVGGRGSPMIRVARIVCTWAQGAPPTNAHEAGHICPHGENSRCVHPGHLRWMTREENERYKQRPDGKT